MNYTSQLSCYIPSLIPEEQSLNMLQKLYFSKYYDPGFNISGFYFSEHYSLEFNIPEFTFYILHFEELFLG